MKKLRIIALAGCFMLLAQVGQFVVLAEEIIKEDGTVVQEEIDKEDRTVEEGTFPTEDGSVDGSGEDVDDGGNTYQVVITNPAVTWESAKAAAEAQNGYLATMTSQAEQDFLMTIIGGYSLWIGGYRDDSYNWYWVTGEKWDYTNWAEGEPNDSSNVVKDEKYVTLWPELWNDLANANVCEQNGYVIEWSEDADIPSDPENPGETDVPSNPVEPEESIAPEEPDEPETPNNPENGKRKRRRNQKRRVRLLYRKQKELLKACAKCTR